MRPDLERLLNVPAYRAFDTAPGGRSLLGSDESGTTQLVDVGPDGTQRPLTALPGACSGRYLIGQDVVLVSHDDGGDERDQPSPLPPPPPAPRRTCTRWPTWCPAGSATSPTGATGWPSTR